MGAGDVKLIAALAAWLGPIEAVYLAIFASMAGGVVGVIVAIFHGYLRTGVFEYVADVDALASRGSAAGSGSDAAGYPGASARVCNSDCDWTGVHVMATMTITRARAAAAVRRSSRWR